MHVDLNVGGRDLADTVRRLNTMLSSVDECFKIVDAAYRLVGMNPRGLELIEAESFAQVEGVDVREILLPEYHEKFERGVARALAGERVTQQFEIRGLAGTRRWMEQVAVAIPNADGTPPTLVAAFTRDITKVTKTLIELADARDRAEASSRAKSDFLANMSHEIRTPMTAIVGHIELLASAQGEPGFDADASLQTVRENADHLMRLIDDVLHLSKHEAGRLEVADEPVDPAELVAGVERLFDATCRDKGLALRTSFTTPVPRVVRTDATKVRQVLSNLVGNAVKFTNDGSIGIEVSATEGMLRVRVVDTGIGITPAQLEQVRRFEPFTQADSSTTRQFGGSGLGLRLCHVFATRLGGSLHVESQAGRGSAVTLSIALVPETSETHAPGPVSAAAPNERPAKPAPARLDGARVLLVEDGVDNQRLVTMHLHSAGAEVVHAQNGRDALAMVAQGLAPDVVIMDMHMPVLDGYATTQRLRAQRFAAPIIALTANAMEGDRERCLEAGCDDYLAKPILRDDLLNACARWHTPDARRPAA